MRFFFASLFARFPGLLYTENAVPTLEQVRGKIVLLRNFDSDASLGIPWDSVNLQDDWDLDSGEGGIERKWTAITSFLQKTNAGPNNELFLNHISASKEDAGPCAVAKGYDGTLPDSEGLNSRLNKYLKKEDLQRAGIVIMDFPGCWLIWRIVELNILKESA